MDCARLTQAGADPDLQRVDYRVLTQRTLHRKVITVKAPAFDGLDEYREKHDPKAVDSSKETFFEQMILRALSISCYVGMVLFLFIFVRAFLFDEHDPSQGLVVASLVLIAIGLLSMIVHINATSLMTDDEKREWRTSVWWGGPITAARYLWRVGGKG